MIIRLKGISVTLTSARRVEHRAVSTLLNLFFGRSDIGALAVLINSEEPIMPQMQTLVIAAILIVAGACPLRAQAFTDIKKALVDYSKADIKPRNTCESLANFKSRDIAQIKAVMAP